jgi:hypothetical protein
MTEKPDSSWAIELFGDENLGVVPLHPEPILSIEDPLFDFQPPTGSGDALIRKLEDADLLEKIIDCDDATTVKIVTLAPLAPAATMPSTDLSDLLKRAVFAHKTTLQRKAAVKSMVDALRNTAVFRPIRDDDRFDSLVRSLDQFVTGSVLMAG